MSIVSCRVCGKKFEVKPCLFKYGWGKYCSQKCKNESQKKGQFVSCAYCGKEVYRPLADLRKKSKTKTYFCNKSCQCAWKNKRRKKKYKLLKNLWRPWCNSNTTRCGRVNEDAISSGLPFLKYLIKKRKAKLIPLKRPSKKVLYNLYWKKNYSQTEIAAIFNATHTSVKRWFNYYKIPVKPRNLSCGHNPNSIKNLELGKTEEAFKKSAEARRIYSKEKLIEKIKEFVQKEGRIPTKKEFANNPSYPDYVTYRDYFGTWNKDIRVAGYEPNERWFASRDLYAQDGHLCNSFSEIIIDDWLFKNDISHIREQPYPEGKYRCDFVIGDIFIEFFGLANTFSVAPHYNEIIKKKKEICRKYKIPLIKLYEKDLYNLDLTLGKKLKIKTEPSASISDIFK